MKLNDDESMTHGRAPERSCKHLVRRHLQFSMTRMTHMTDAQGG
jgi:hypothetical protein